MSGLDNMFEKIKLWWKRHNHMCTPKKYSDTGEVIEYHWDVPWSFSQTFTVCSECRKVKVLSEIKNDNRGSYQKETDGEQWSGMCDYAKIPSIGRDKLMCDNWKRN
jgi:hypothetical protein